MGYYTDYTLTVKNVPEEMAPALKYALTEDIGMEWWDDESYFANAKWYDHDKDMKALSLRFPGVLFELYGDGEESDDMWYTYYKDGKMQYCPVKITFEPYDESKLQ